MMNLYQYIQNIGRCFLDSKEKGYTKPSVSVLGRQENIAIFVLFIIII